MHFGHSTCVSITGLFSDTCQEHREIVHDVTVAYAIEEADITLTKVIEEVDVSESKFKHSQSDLRLYICFTITIFYYFIYYVFQSFDCSCAGATSLSENIDTRTCSI